MIKFIEKFHEDEECLSLVNINNDLNKILILRTLLTSIIGIGLFLWSICLIPFMLLFDIIYYFYKSMLLLCSIPKILFKNHFIESGLNRHAKKLDKLGYLMLSNFEHYKNQNLYNFIRNFLYTYRNDYLTKNHKGDVVCDTYRRRSAGDIYRICKTYYPECTFHEVMTNLIKIARIGDCGASYCNTINKFVFHTDGYHFQPKGKIEYLNGGFKFNDIIKYYEQKKKS